MRMAQESVGPGLRIRRLGGGVVLAVMMSLASLTQAQPLQDAVVSLKNRASLGTATFSAVAVDAKDGRLLFAIDPKAPMIPASNQKLLTSGAALMVLGTDFQFETTLVQAGDRLILRGSGDPALGDPEVLKRGGDIGIEDLLAQMVQAIKLRGIERVDEILVDDRVFDRDYAHPSWPLDQLNTWYCAEIGGVNIHTNVLAVYPRPAAGGQGLPIYSVEPSVSWFEIANYARSVTEGRQTAWIARPKPVNEFQLRGDVRYPGAEPIRVAFHNPPLTAGQLLADRLVRAGIPVGKPGGPSGVNAARLVGLDEILPSGQDLLVVRTRMKDILDRCNTDSYNLYAEAMIKRLGNEINHEPGSWENGGAVIRMLLAEKLGPEHATRTQIADGSGMSRENKVSAETLAAWLLALRSDPAIHEAMLASLATPGEGTLSTRFVSSKLHNDVYGKSGYLNGVRSLSGYVVADDGREIVYSMLMNDIPAGKPNQNSRVFLEQVVEQLDVWLWERSPTASSAYGG